MLTAGSQHQKGRFYADCRQSAGIILQYADLSLISNCYNTKTVKYGNYCTDYKPLDLLEHYTCNRLKVACFSNIISPTLCRII